MLSLRARISNPTPPAVWRLASAGILASALILACGSDGNTGASTPFQDASTPDGTSDGAGSCVPATCASAGVECGKVPDGCGGVLSCAVCPANLFCGGAGPNKCGSTPCTAKNCAVAGAECGPASDGCGSVLDCGGCPGSATCSGNKCVASSQGGSGGSEQGGSSGDGGSTSTGGTTSQGGSAGAGGGGTGGALTGGSGGTGGASCVAGDACASNPGAVCKNGLTACPGGASGPQTCEDSGNAPDHTDCGSSLVCRAGVCEGICGCAAAVGAGNAIQQPSGDGDACMRDRIS